MIGHVASGIAGGLAAAALLAAGLVRPGGRADTIETGRIDIREPDGTLRMVLSSAAREPGIVVGGREQPHPSRRSAGILFYNDEGTENGGLIFDGRRDAGGPHSGGSLTFDRYRQDQAVQVVATEDGPARRAGLVVNDHPDEEIDFAAVERARRLPAQERDAAYAAAHLRTTRRLFAGRAADGGSEVVLQDAAGTPRLRLRVAAAGAASITFLDGTGRPVRTIGPDSR